MPFSAAQFREAAKSFLHRLSGLRGKIEYHKFPQTIFLRFDRSGPKSLANRILMLQFFWMLFIYFLVIAALWLASELVIENSVRHQGESWITKLDELGIPLYATNNPAKLKQAISYLHNFPEIARVKYLDESGTNVIAEYSRKNNPIDDFPPLSESVIEKLSGIEVEQKTLLFEKSGTSLMHISAPIWVKSISSDGMTDYSLDKPSGEKIEIIGFIELALDYSNTTSDLNHNIFYASMIIAVMMLIASFVLRIMVHWALKPLSELEEPLTRLANGETDITVSTSGDKEIARIGVALNTTISALKDRDEALRQMADHDALTGIPNRRVLADRLKQAIAQAHRTGKLLSVCYIDLDGFKQVNDQFGHAAGDQLLIEITRRLQETVRSGDTLARLGGDEFAVLFNDLASENECLQILDRVLEMVAKPIIIGNDKVTVSASIGVAFRCSDKDDGDTLLRHADQAMYVSKQTGKCRYHRYDHTTESGISLTQVGT